VLPETSLKNIVVNYLNTKAGEELLTKFYTSRSAVRFHFFSCFLACMHACVCVVGVVNWVYCNSIPQRFGQGLLLPKELEELLVLPPEISAEAK
jgi:hypothetical protein